MTANSILGARETVEMMARLKDAASQFASREEALLGTERRLRERETAAAESAVAQCKAKTATQLGETESGFNGARDRQQALFTARCARIATAQKNVLQQSQLAVDQIMGRGKFTLQKGLLDAERLRDSNRTDLQTSQREIDASHQQTQTAFAEMERDAARLFRAYIGFKALLAPNEKRAEAIAPADPDVLRSQLFDLRELTWAALDRFRRNPVTQLFRWLPIWLLAATLLGLYAGAPFILQQIGGNRIPPSEAQRGFLIVLGGVVLLYLFSHWRSKPFATQIAANLERFRQLDPVCQESSDRRFQELNQQLKTEHSRTVRELNEAWWQAEREAESQKAASHQAIHQKVERLLAINQKIHDRRSSALTAEYQATLAALKDAAESTQIETSARHQTTLEQLNADIQRQWQDLDEAWQRDLAPIFNGLESSTAAANVLAPNWNLPAATSGIAPPSRPVRQNSAPWKLTSERW